MFNKINIYYCSSIGYCKLFCALNDSALLKTKLLENMILVYIVHIVWFVVGSSYFML